MATADFRIRRTAVLAALATALSSPAAADCTCRALGRDFELGRTVCLSTSQGPRLAICGMVLNNTSWRFSDVPCVVSQTPAEHVSELMPRPGAGHLTVGR